jgi:DNA-directed RNA polymerase subunit M/transcription elongation factor TFIIS
MTHMKFMVERETLHRVGMRLDDQLEALEKDKLKAEGAAIAVAGLPKKIMALHQHVDDELDQGSIKTIEEAKKVKLYVTRALETCEQSAQAASELKVKLEARMEGLKQAIGEVKKQYDLADQRIRVFQQLAKKAEGQEDEEVVDPQEAAAPEDPKPRRQTGEHPGPSVKERRLAEVEEAKARVQGAQEAVRKSADAVEKNDTVMVHDPVVAEAEALAARQKAQEGARRADGRFQCGTCRRHFVTWDELQLHCADERHQPRQKS